RSVNASFIAPVAIEKVLWCEGFRKGNMLFKLNKSSLLQYLNNLIPVFFFVILPVPVLVYIGRVYENEQVRSSFRCMVRIRVGGVGYVYRWVVVHDLFRKYLFELISIIIRKKDIVM